ncbi:unnamed protein product [Mytilus coruscus]|uniref:VWFA domain-containing protein n=1 Tax=Mytilus coruscus TaxID=42192 RepID=A0A6J8AVU4_MYTCO|nr:unnamed protein product [Mytilus coruscus]
MTMTTSLLDYQWGTEKTFSSREELGSTNENVFMVKFSIHLCLETNNPNNCVVDLPIMDNVKLPKGTCDWKKGFNNDKFILQGWLGETYTNKDTLDPYVVNELMRDLQLIDYLMEPQCDVSTAPYTPVNAQGWNISPGCTTAPTLPTLTSEVTCNLGDSCTSIKCCVTSVKLGRTFTIDLDLDVCNQTFMVGVDRLTRTVALASFVFSQEDVFSFDGLINVKYKIDDFQSDNQYMINLDIDICYRANQPTCTVQLQILHDARLTKETCTVDSGFAIPNFSLVNWLTSQGISPSISLIPSYIVDLLTEDLGINGYLKAPSCVMASSGWDTSACPETVSLTTLPSYTSCQLPSYCTGVQCCTEIGILGRSWQTFVLVDTCKYRVSIGIENQMVNITLFEFVQGTWATVTLGNVLRLGYMAKEITAENVYQFTVNVSICFESAGDCHYEYTVFDNTKIPIPPCNWTDTDYNVPGFQLSNWLNEFSYPDTVPLSDLAATQLMEHLGLSAYVNPTQCDRMSTLYIPGINGWKSGCTSVTPTTILGDDVSCHLYDSCTGVVCCLNSTRLDRTFNSYLKLDPCTQKLMIGVEKYQFEFSLFDFQFDVDQIFHLDKVLHILYKVKDLPGDRAYLVDMTLLFCLNDPSPCDVNVTIFDKTKLPKSDCPWSTGFNKLISHTSFVDWSLNDWYTDSGFTNNTDLSADAIAKLMEALGLTEYMLDTSCDRTDSSVYALAYQGWSSGCFTPVTLASLDDSTITCNLDSSCRAIDCCLDVPVIKKSVHIFMNLDSCNYQLRVGIEKLQFNITLRDYQFGEWTLVDLNGVIRMNFIIHDLYAENEYLISLNISVCFEQNSCQLVYDIFNNVRLPRPTCDWNKQFQISDFSISEYKKMLNVTVMADHQVAELLEKLGIAEFMNPVPCDRNSARFNSSMEWVNDCTETITALRMLDNTTTCHLLSTCTGIECCSTSESLGLTLNSYVYLDPCNYRLSIGIEQIQLNYSLVDYNWGEWIHYSLYDVYNLNFVAEDLIGDEQYVISLNISLCLESSGPCEVALVIFDNDRLSKPTCDWNTDFIIPGFSLKTYLLGKGLDPDTTTQLSIHMASQLLHDIGVAPALLDTQCERESLPYHPSSDEIGWNKGCTQQVTLPNLPNGTNCHFYDSCTGVSCCTDIDLIQHSITWVLRIETCQYQMFVGIEKIEIGISLLDYNFGQKDYFKLHGVFGIEYMVEDLAQTYRVNMNLTVCMESSEPCDIIVPVLTDTVLPKPVCNWKTGFIDPDFSYSAFLTENDIGVNDTLDSTQLSILLHTLGLTDFLLNPQCNRSGAPYAGAVNGWTNNCTSAMDPLPSIVGEANCHIASHCTAVYCCLYNPRMARSFETRVNFEPCLFKLTVSIEELTFDILLSDYVWTEPTDVWLFGFVRMEFTAVDLVVEGDYMLDLVLRVCMEADADTTVLCFININVLTKYRLPKEQCDWDFNFFVSGFSLNSWLANNNYTRTEPLPLTVSAKLLSHLNVQSYLNHPTCQQEGSLYTTAGTRWNNVCGKEIDLPMLSEDIVCRVNDSCTTIDCCVNVPLLNQTFNFYLDIDPCYQEVTVGIEKMLTTQKLLDGYTFGSFHNFTLLGVGRMEYSIEDFPGEGVYVINLKIRVCFETVGPCEIDEVILDDLTFPKMTCTWDETYNIQDFALNQWLRVRSESTDDILPGYYIAEILQQLDLTSYLQDTPCSRDSVPYVNATNGWNSACADNITLHSLWSDSPSNPLTCSFNSECSGVSCCIDSMFINRSFYTNLELDPCEQKLHIGIEKLQFTVSLLDFVFDKDQEFSLKKTIRILYNIYDLKSENEYLITLKMAVCWETYLPCDWTATLFENTRLPKKSCSQRMDYVTPDFSLTDWAADNGVDVNNMIDLDVHKFYDAADIGWFLQFPSCDRGDTPFGPTTNGWNNTCPGIITDLNDLPSTTSCYISTSCTDVRCCIEIPTLNNFTIDFTVSLDDCQKTLTVTIEKWTHSQMLHNYTWGTEEYFWVRGVYRIKFRVYDLNDQALFRLYISFEACFEAGQPCTQTIDIMNSIELPKQDCTWSTGYRISDCPLYVLGDLVFLLDESISVGSSHFNKSLEAIASAVNNLAIGANLTRVGFVVFGGNQTTNRTIFDMNYDKAAILNGILNTKHDPGIANTVSVLKYVCDNKFMESVGGRTAVQNYLVVLSDGRSANHEDIKIQSDLCSTAGIRIIGVPIGDAANDALLKAISYFDPSYYVKTVYSDLGPTIAALVNSSVDCSSGFFLKSWKTGHGLADNAVLNEWQISSLMQENRITEYVVADQCSLTTGMFSGATDGWVNECSLGVTTLPIQSPMLICHVSDRCTDIDCCLYDTETFRHYNLFLHLDPCTYRLQIGVELYSFDVSLLDFDFEKSYEVDLSGIFRILFNVEDLVYEESYVVNMEIHICWDITNPCNLEVTVLKNVILYKQPCNLTTYFAVDDFSLTNWFTDTGYPPSVSLSGDVQQDLMETLDIFNFLNSPYQCQMSGGWNDSCPETAENLPVLPNSINCTITEGCTTVECCVESVRLQRHFHTVLTIDPCHYNMTVGIDRYTFNVNIQDKPWGKHFFFLHEFFYICCLIIIRF